MAGGFSDTHAGRKKTTLLVYHIANKETVQHLAVAVGDLNPAPARPLPASEIFHHEISGIVPRLGLGCGQIGQFAAFIIRHQPLIITDVEEVAHGKPRYVSDFRLIYVITVPPVP